MKGTSFGDRIVMASFVAGGLWFLSRRIRHSSRWFGTTKMTPLLSTSLEDILGIHNVTPRANSAREGAIPPYKERADYFCGLCGVALDLEPHAIRNYFQMRLLSTAGDDVNMDTIVHLSCARKLVKGLIADHAVWEIDDAVE